MSGPVHFDAAEANRMIEKTIADAEKAVRAQNKPKAMADLEIASFTIMRGMAQFLLSAKNQGVHHEGVAEIAGFALGNALVQVCQNYSCGCVQGRVLDAMFQAMAAHAAGGNAIVSQMQGTRGGRA